jgi:hypothetical protein
MLFQANYLLFSLNYREVLCPALVSERWVMRKESIFSQCALNSLNTKEGDSSGSHG